MVLINFGLLVKGFSILLLRYPIYCSTVFGKTSDSKSHTFEIICSFEIILFLFLNKYSNKAEGELTSLRSALVNTITISQVATELKMNDFLLLSKGETKDAGKARQYILANTFEAFIGAVYLDQGYQPAQKFIKFNLLGRTNEIVSKGLWRDAKSLIQEKAQEYIGITPFYQVIDEEGPDHNKKFTVGIYFDKELMAEGRGDSKQEAEQQAAQLALKVKNWE